MNELTFELTPAHLAYFVSLEYFIQNKTWKFVEFLEAAQETFKSYVSLSWIYKYFETNTDQKIRECLAAQAMRFSILFDNIDFRANVSREIVNRVPAQFIDPNTLPWNPAERLAELFHQKKIWFPSEIRAFLDPVTKSSASRDEIISKHTTTIYMPIKNNGLEAFLRLHPCEKESVSEEKATGQLRIRCLQFK